MMIQSYSKGRTTKTVVILDTANNSDDEILALAMTHAGETKSSLFGWRVKRYDGNASATVELYTD